MIFKQRSNLKFAGLLKIQELLELQLADLVPEDTLLILASLPSLDDNQKAELVRSVNKYQKIIFWCYGDLIWNVELWVSLEDKLIGKDVQWIVASKRWKDLASLIIPFENIVIHPHPLIIDKCLPNQRKEKRSILGIKDNEKLLLYAGRRSSQKNLPWLVKLWRMAADKSDVPIKLAVAGPWCNYGIPQFPSAEQSTKNIQGIWGDLLGMYPHDLLDLGELNFEEVTYHIQASDAVLSVSTFLEEDFGMLPREARTLGVPVLATNWGGFADLNDSGSFLINLEHEEGKLNLDFNHAHKQLSLALGSRLPAFEYANQKITLGDLNLNKFLGFKSFEIDDLNLEKWQRLMLGLQH